MITKPEGTQDLFGDEAEEWEKFVRAAKMVAKQKQYSRIDTPAFEKEELFVRGIGESSDVVNKEMFSVFSGGNLAKMKADEKLSAKSKFALRPEGTAGVVRAAIENGLVKDAAQPLRVWYAGSMFRAERPQKGRLREFHQIGLECIGGEDAFLDAQAVMLMLNIFEMYGIDDSKIELHLNTMGCEKCRPAWRDAVRDFIDVKACEMCDVCRERALKNPLRAFDCKNEKCRHVMKDAPKIDGFLCSNCHTHYEKVKQLLNVAEVEYVLDATLVRGLDYYTRTVFEAQFTEGLGAQNAIGGGGRYDGLVSELGGKNVPALGFAMGFERCLLAKRACCFTPEEIEGADFFFIPLCDEGKKFAEEFAMNPALKAHSFDMDFRCQEQGDSPFRSLKSQLRLANKLRARCVIILGEEEMRERKATIKRLSDHKEWRISLEEMKNVGVLDQLIMEAV